jgi:ubiquinone/menaquinone biosynthesis C-methylase UbiE
MKHNLLADDRPLTDRRGTYGYDEPIWIFLLSGLGALSLGAGLVSFRSFARLVSGTLGLISGLFFLSSAASYVYTTRQGKFQVWADILRGLRLRGDEQLLDLGCGRGAVLLMAARLLPHGHATGIDIWNVREQSGNSLAITQQNAEREGVADRVVLQTADMRQLPFANETFDLVLSSMAIHNIADTGAREQAIDEAARVVKPGGRLALVDFGETPRYAARLAALGMVDVTDRALGWRFWYGGPWVAPRLVQARKPVGGHSSALA